MKRVFPIVVAAVLFVVDRILKAIVVKGTSASFGFGKFTLFKNEGLVFSIPAPYYISLGLMIVAVAALGLLLWRYRSHGFILWPLMLFVAGTASNIFDRIHYGYIVDYVYLSDRLPIINLADAMLTAGVIILVFSLRKIDKEVVSA
jgi:signal peptidase II